MSPRELLYACIALVVISITVVAVFVWYGVKSDIALTLSSIAMMGCIAMAFLATNATMRSMGDDLGQEHKKN